MFTFAIVADSLATIRPLLEILTSDFPGAPVRFLPASSISDTIRIASGLREKDPDMRIYAMGRITDPDSQMAILRSGVREFFATSLPPSLIRAALHREPAPEPPFYRKRPIPMRQLTLQYEAWRHW